MPTINVSPQTFEMVNFQASDIEALAKEVATAVGLPDTATVTITVDETEMMARATSKVDGDTITIEAAGGAFESLRKAREFAPERCRAVLGQVLMRARDRLDPAFGDPPPDDDMDVHLEAAWSTYIEGRLDRLGVLEGRPQRRIYHFRVRHGFTDEVDRAFDQLWNGDGLTWADLEKISAAADQPVATDKTKAKAKAT
jgi:hypothetical protein